MTRFSAVAGLRNATGFQHSVKYLPPLLIPIHNGTRCSSLREHCPNTCVQGSSGGPEPQVLEIEVDSPLSPNLRLFYTLSFCQ